MSRLEDFAIGVLLLVVLAVAGDLALKHYGTTQRQAGYDAAVAAGKDQHDRDAAAAHKTESDLRDQLAARDADAHQKDIENAQALEDAQRRVRAGTDRLRCPAAGTVQPAAPAGDRPAAGGPAADAGGPDLVPEAAADVLGDGAAIAGLVRRYDRVVERFEACRAVNAGP